jgi:hypothetical protein
VRYTFRTAVIVPAALLAVARASPCATPPPRLVGSMRFDRDTTRRQALDRSFAPLGIDFVTTSPCPVS